MSKKLTWVNFLHIYQPPTQTPEIVDKVTRESYELILKLLQKYPCFRITLNISGSLVELLEQNKHTDILISFKKFVDNKQVELVGSAMYHPILALLPEKEIERQIELNTQILKKYFGNSFAPAGFFIPEMAYRKKVADVAKKMGFTWIILDEIHFPESTEKPNPSIKYIIKDNGMNVLFRNRSFSQTFPPEYILEHKDTIESDTIIIAHDGELYGHWHIDDKGYYEKAFTHSQITMKTVSEYLQSLEKTEEIVVREASWESLKPELEHNNPYALWDSSDNEIHKKLWEFANFVIDIIEKNQDDPNFASARNYLDRGLASCAWWWATGRKLLSTSPICWNPTEVEKGAQELLNAVRSLKTVDKETHIEAEKKCNELRDMIWNKHWSLQTSSQ